MKNSIEYGFIGLEISAINASDALIGVDAQCMRLESIGRTFRLFCPIFSTRVD